MLVKSALIDKLNESCRFFDPKARGNAADAPSGC